jgi:tetratricopeptide (TPR) repeat protein
MSGRWPACAARESVLADLERAIAATPAALDTRFYYASFLRDHGRLDEAIDVFAAVLAAAPDHVETLVAYGAALARAGRRLEARAALERAVAADGAHYAALVSLANALALDAPDRAATLYDAAIALAPQREAAHRGRCSLAASRGDAARAARHRAAGYGSGPFVRRPYFGAQAPHASILALVSTDGGNLALDALIDPHTIATTELYVDAYRGEPLPPHDLIVNAIADADRAPVALRRAEAIVAGARVRVINVPRAVAATGRVANAARLATLAGVIAPPARPIRAGEVPAAYPVIVRAPGLHMGRGMILARDGAAYERAVASFGARSDLLAIPYVQTCSPDGAWRKYRVMQIGGVLAPLHLAIAKRWDVHYFSSAMRDDAAYRAEEAAFLADPRATIGTAAWSALERVGETLALDYAGIDFGLAPDGRIVVFEANAAMTVLPPDGDARFAYRRAAADAIGAALRALILGPAATR